MSNKLLSMRTHSFYQKHANLVKKLLLPALCVMALLSPFVFFEQGNNQKNVAPKNATESAQQANPASAESLQYPNTANGKVLQRGLGYLQGRVTSIPPFERLMLDYLQRKYGISQAFSASKTPIKSPTLGEQEDPAQYRAFQRIAYPNDLVKSLPAAPDDIMSEMMLVAANCDHIPLPTNFGDLVNQNIQAGQYNLTHVAFALRLMEDNECSYFTPQQIKTIDNQVSNGILQLAGDAAIMADLRYEAIAFLCEMGQGSRVHQSWVDEIAGKQLKNGSWSQSGRDSVARDHTTLLAVWTLLAQNNPNAPKEPMIHRPN